MLTIIAGADIVTVDIVELAARVDRVDLVTTKVVAWIRIIMMMFTIMMMIVRVIGMIVMILQFLVYNHQVISVQPQTLGGTKVFINQLFIFFICFAFNHRHHYHDQ